tara:strand:- start:449 stop:3991 length:3543 start_codon:yes stop_codon:yes gene_type:complete
MAYYGNTPPPIQISLPTPQLPPVANANPFIPEDIYFWVSTDLHTVRLYDSSTGEIATTNNLAGTMKSMIMGDVNFWIRGSGDPYLTNFDKLSSGLGEEHDFDGNIMIKENNPSLATNNPPDNCRTCFESSGTVDSSFLDDFSQSVANHVSRPPNNNYDHTHFWYSSSRIETYGNRVPGTGIYTGSLTIDKIVYMNGIPTRLITSAVHSNDVSYRKGDNPDPRGHYHYDRLSSSVMPHTFQPHGLHSYRYGVGTDDQNYNAWLTMVVQGVSHPGSIYMESTWYDYLGTGVYGGNNIASAMQDAVGPPPMLRFVSSSGTPPSGPFNAGNLFEASGLYSQGQVTGAIGYYDGGAGYPKKFSRSIWYIENTQSFNQLFRKQSGSIAGGVGAWPHVPLYFMTSSSVTTRGNGDWMPEGLRTKAESLALALNFYGQFWGPTDIGATLAITGAAALDQFDGEGYQGSTLEKMTHTSVPYTWSVDSNDNLIYTSSLCSGSRIDHAHTGQMTFVKGHRSGTVFAGTASAQLWAANNPVNSGSVTWSSARGYTTFSGLMDQVGNYHQYSSNFKEGLYNYERAYRFDYNNWKVLGDTGVSASIVVDSSRGAVVNQPMLTGVSRSLEFEGLYTGTSQSADTLDFFKSLGFITGSEKNTTGPEHLGLRFEKEFNQSDLRYADKLAYTGVSTVGGRLNPTLLTNGLLDIMTENQYIIHKTYSNEAMSMYNGESCNGASFGTAATHTGTAASLGHFAPQTPSPYSGNLVGRNSLAFASDGAQPEFARYTTWADTHQRYTKRSTCTCTEVFKWRSIPPQHNDFIYDLEFSDGFKFSTLAYTRLFMYNPTFLNQGTPLHPTIPTSQYWPHSLRAITPDELFNYTGSGVSSPNYSAPPVDTYKLNPIAAFVKCSDIIPGTTRTNGYVYLKDIKRRKVTIKNPSHRSRYNSLQEDNKFNINKNNVECLFNASTSIQSFTSGSSTPFGNTELTINLAIQNGFDSNMILTSSVSTNNMYTGYVHANPEPWRDWYIQSQSANGVNYTFTASVIDNANSGTIYFNNTAGQTLSTVSGNGAALSSSGGQLFYTYLEQHDAAQPGQYTPFAYAATTAYPRNHFTEPGVVGDKPSNHSGSIIYDGMLMLENGLYVGFEGPNCWTHDEYDLQSRNPCNRTAGDFPGYSIGGGQYDNPLGFPGSTQRT